MAIEFDLLVLIGIFVAVGLLILRDRKKVEFSYGLIIRRWDRGQYKMDRWIFAHEKFLKIVGTVAVVFGILAAIGGIGSIIYFTIVSKQAVAPILPTIGDFEYPQGIIGVQPWLWIIGIIVALTAHEPMHAVFSRLAKVPVKSWGFLTFLVIPLGAFVDPDMKKIQKLKLMEKLRIFAGGSFGNFVVGTVTAIILFSMGTTMFGQATIPGTPAAEAGVEGNLISVNGLRIGSIDDLTKVLSETPAGSTVEVVTEKGAYSVNTISPPRGGEGSYLGLSFGLKPQFQSTSSVISTIYQMFFWIFVFNVGVGIFNMLPIKVLDGGHMFEAIFLRIFKNGVMARNAIHITSLVVLGIILFNVFGTGLIKFPI